MAQRGQFAKRNLELGCWQGKFSHFSENIRDVFGIIKRLRLFCVHFLNRLNNFISSVTGIQMFESLFIYFQVQRPQSLLEASRVAVRDQITEVSSGRSILPSIERLPLPKQLKKYVALVDDLWG